MDRREASRVVGDFGSEVCVDGRSVGLSSAGFDWGQHCLSGDTKDRENGGFINRIILPFYDLVKLSIVGNGIVVKSETWKQFLLGRSC